MIHSVNILLTMLLLCYASRPNQNQIANSAWLSYNIYFGASPNNLNTGSGKVIKYHESDNNGAYAIWKHESGDCYIAVRGTNIKKISDILTDINVLEVRDDELGVYVHNGVYLRSNFIFGDIGSGLSECNKDIIITGHSLGGSVTHYLLLKYYKKHYYDWSDSKKAMRFKGVMFGAPQLVSDTGKNELKHIYNNINWYKYEKDPVPDLIQSLRKLSNALAVFYAFSGRISITNLALQTLLNTHFGSFIPGSKYQLNKNGNTNLLLNIFQNIYQLSYHEPKNYCDAILRNGWGTSNILTNGQLDKGEINEIHFENEYNDDRTIDINTTSCYDTDEYRVENIYDDVEFYVKGNYESYVIKRLLDNEKEYEYAICKEKEFIVKQCDKECNCHEVLKNNRPENIVMCSSYQDDGVKQCLIDEKIENVEVKDYFGFMSQTKINDYYLMDYYCNNVTYHRGNYVKDIESSNSIGMMILSAIFLILII